MRLGEILTDVVDGVLTITLSNPEVRNASSQAMFNRIGEVIKATAPDRSIRVVVIRGEGEWFCSGGDLRKTDGSRTDISLEERAARNRAAAILVEDMRDMPQPTIAMVRGPAAGAGLSLAMACDFRFAGTDALFTTAFAKVGGSGDLGSVFLLRELVGLSKAKELMMLSDKIRGPEALAIGLVDRLYEPEALEAETYAFAARLAASAPIALGAIKQNFQATQSGSIADYLNAESQNMITCMSTEDHREAVEAFKAKRTPTFVGR